MDLDQFLLEALQHQARRPKPHRKRKRKDTTPDDYARRLSEKALYRRLINETNIAQDGIRFIFYFSQPSHSEARSLDDWRKKIDREIITSRDRSAKGAEDEANLDSKGEGNAET